MGTVLVCVRSSVAAQGIASCAARLGVGSAIRTAVSEAEALAYLAEGRADVVLADTLFVRPDPVAFTRRVLWRAPEATLILLGPEEPHTAAAVVAAGARGVIRTASQDLVTVVTKALLLVCPPPWPNRSAAAPGPPGAISASGSAAADRPAVPGAPVQPPGDRDRARSAASGAGPRSRAAGAPGSAAGAGPVPAQRRETAASERALRRRLALTDRELQVLRAMAEGRSNAEIGRELFVSEDTVKTHARRLFRKLGVRDRAHAVAAGFRAGLVT